MLHPRFRGYIRCFGSGYLVLIFLPYIGVVISIAAILAKRLGQVINVRSPFPKAAPNEIWLRVDQGFLKKKKKDVLK